MGRPRKPTHLKLIQGTFRPDRANPNEPAPSPELPTPPAWLSERGAELFRELVVTLDGLGLASKSDAYMLAILASRLDEVEICTAIVEDAGRLYVSRVVKDEQGNIIARQAKSHPCVAQRNEAAKHAQALLSQFGLSPASRGKVNARPGLKAPNPFSEF